MLAPLRQTIAAIRFGLSQLSGTNGHFDFEHLCRFLARETVSRNIIPATGPVAAGGDQGRDFETYRTKYPGEIGPLGARLGIQDGEAVAFGCTLQAKDIPSKILADVKAILEQGTQAQHVVYYCETTVPVARRHTLQERVRTDYNCHLEVFDGLAIAELLAQRHLFWIAQEYLHLPAAALPPGPERPDWYEDDLARWRSFGGLPATSGDLVDLSGCVRFATLNEDARRDLPFWIEKLALFLRGDVPSAIEQKARYEIAVAQLRGLGDLRPFDEVVAQYMTYAVGSENPSDLDDAATLLMFCVGARERGLTDHDEECLRRWNLLLQARIKELIGQTELAGLRCSLLESLGSLRSQPDLASAKREGVPYARPSDDLPMSNRDFEEILHGGLAKPIRVPIIDLAGAFDAWTEMVKTMDAAPLFPVDRSSVMLRILAPLLIEDERYDQIVTAIDRRIQAVQGNSAAAEKARDRAVTFYEHGRLLDALRDFHRARIGWFSGETSRGLILATLMVSQVYRELELPAAAKYFALVAARLVQSDDIDLYAQALLKAAEADYHVGAWFSTVLLTDAALEAHVYLAKDPYKLERHHYVQKAFFDLSVIRAVAKSAQGTYREFVEAILQHGGLNEFLDDLLGQLPSSPWWESLQPGQFEQEALEQLGHPAFSDGGTRRTLTWRALGATWAVDFANDYESTLVAERFSALAQIIIAEFVREDPAILPTRIKFEIQPSLPGTQLEMSHRSDGAGTTWHARVSTADISDTQAYRKVTEDSLQLVLAAIADVSMLPLSELDQIIEKLFQNGLLSKLLPGSLYDVAYSKVVDRNRFDSVPRLEAPPLPLDAQARPLQHRDVVIKGDGPHYDQKTARELVSGRYAKISAALVSTLPALQQNLQFLEIARRLVDQGWKDWHILLAIFQIVQNYRFRIDRPPESAEAHKKLANLFTSAEERDKPAPLELFTEESLKRAIQFSWASTLQLWELTLRQNPPDFPALEQLLADRYGYWSDDVEHNAMFSF